MTHLIEMRKITKKFGSVVALDNVDFWVRNGEFVGLIGANGAGKSTLIKVISGIFEPDKGEIFFKGKKVKIKNPIQSRKLGIETVHQDLSLINTMTVRDNLFLGRYPVKRKIIIDYPQISKKADMAIHEIGVDLNPIELVKTLSGGERQALALARTRIRKKLDLLIVDEPTTALADPIKKKIIKKMKEFNKDGLSIIYISHDLEGVLNVAEKVFVLKRGRSLGTFDTDKLTIHKCREMIA